MQSRLPRFGTWLLLTGGIVPDLDYASYLGGPAVFLGLHRSALHSIPGAVVTSCALAAVFRVLDKKWPAAESRKTRRDLRFSSALALGALGVAMHDLLDLASGEGVHLLWPLRTTWSRWSLVEWSDPWVLMVLIGGLLIPQLFRLVNEEVGARRKRESGSGAALATLLILAAYLGARAYLHGRAVDLLVSSEYHGREPLAAGAFPSSNPFDWRGVVSTDNTLEEINVRLVTGSDFNPDRSLTRYKPARSPELEISEKTPEAQRFLGYAEFPFASAARREDGYRVELRDLRFSAQDTGPENIVVRVELNSSLQITSQGLRYASSAGN